MPDIRLGVAVLCTDRGRLLLGRHNRGPNLPRDRWGLIGGEVGFLESTRDAAERLMAARSGLRITLGGITATAEVIHPPLTHVLTLFYAAEAISSALVPEDDRTELRWFDHAELIAAVEAGDIGGGELEVLRIAGRVPRAEA